MIPRKRRKPLPRQVKSYGDFRGGWNADAAPDSLADNELERADNVNLDERGAATKRKGTVPLNATSYGAQVEQLIEWPRNDGTRILLAVIGTTLCKIAEDGTKTDLVTLANPWVGYFYLQDKFYFVDGSEYRVYDGTTVSTVTPNSATDNDLAPIKRCKYLLWHPKSFRVFAAGDSQDQAALYFSEPNEPDYFKETSKLYPTTGDGPVNGLVVFGGAVEVMYRGSVWAWTGIDPATDATWEKLPAHQGTIAPRTVELTPASLTFLGVGGVYSLSPGILDYSVIMLTGDELMRNRAKDKVTSVLRSIAYPENACGVYDRLNSRYLLAYSDDPANTRNNKVLVLDWGLQTWSRYTGWQVNDWCLRDNGDLLFATDGYILKTGQGYRDWSPAVNDYVPIEFAVRTKQWSLDAPTHRKKVRRIFLAARQFKEENSSVNLEITADYKSATYQDIPLDESLVWGDPWGRIWGWVDLLVKEMRVRLTAQRFQASLENSKLDEPLTIYGLAFEYSARTPKAMLYPPVEVEEV